MLVSVVPFPARFVECIIDDHSPVGELLDQFGGQFLGFVSESVRYGDDEFPRKLGVLSLLLFLNCRPKFFPFLHPVGRALGGRYP